MKTPCSHQLRLSFQFVRSRAGTLSVRSLILNSPTGVRHAGSVCGLLKFFAMGIFIDRLALKRFDSLLILMLCTASLPLHAQAPTAPSTSAAAVPEWAQPGSPTHVQVPPPADFHRPSRNFEAPIGLFQGQSDIGAAVVPGSAYYDANTKQYTINSAGYNIWYSRDEFRYLWKKMSGDVSLAADVTFPGSASMGWA